MWKKLTAIFVTAILSVGCSRQMPGREFPLSCIDKAECSLCSPDMSGLFHCDNSEGVAVLCLNTWAVGSSQIYVYDESGNLIDNAGYELWRHEPHGQDGAGWSFHSNPSRHTCELTITYGDNAGLDLEALAGRVCQNCLDKITDALFYGEYGPGEVRCDVLLDLHTHEIYPVTTSNPAYYIQDIWVHIEHLAKQNQDKIYLVYNPASQK